MEHKKEFDIFESTDVKTDVKSITLINKTVDSVGEKELLNTYIALESNIKMKMQNIKDIEDNIRFLEQKDLPIEEWRTMIDKIVKQAILQTGNIPEHIQIGQARNAINQIQHELVDMQARLDKMKPFADKIKLEAVKETELNKRKKDKDKSAEGKEVTI